MKYILYLLLFTFYIYPFPEHQRKDSDVFKKQSYIRNENQSYYQLDRNKSFHGLLFSFMTLMKSYRSTVHAFFKSGYSVAFSLVLFVIVSIRFDSFNIGVGLPFISTINPAALIVLASLYYHAYLNNKSYTAERLFKMTLFVTLVTLLIADCISMAAITTMHPDKTTTVNSVMFPLELLLLSILISTIHDSISKLILNLKNILRRHDNTSLANEMKSVNSFLTIVISILTILKIFIG